MASYAAIPHQTNSRPHSRVSSRRKPSRHDARLDHPGPASWTSSVINLLNTIVGAGVLAMPHALSTMGATLGTLVILWAGLTSGFGLYLQTRCARYLDRGTSSFFALSQMTYPNAAVVFDAAIAIKCFGVGVSYLIIIGDLMPGVVRGFGEVEGGFLVERRFWVTAFMLVVIPLSFLRRLDSLKYTSILALSAIAYLVVLVVYHFAAGDTLAEKGPVNLVKWQGLVPTLASFPVIVFAYTCHQNMFSILNELHQPSPSRTTSLIATSIGSAASVYILVALTGYLSYGTNVVGNIIAQYPPSAAATIGRLAIVIMVALSYPLQIHPCRASLDAVLRWRPQTTSTKPPHQPGSPSRHTLLPSTGASSAQQKKDLSDLRFALLTTCLLLLSYTAAITLSSLDRVLAYVGSTGSTSISFILPGLFYYKISDPDSPWQHRLAKDDDDEDDGDDGEPSSAAAAASEANHARRVWRARWLRRLSLALAVYGLLVMVTCLVVNTFLLNAPAH
ncbi:hypothetical protein B0A50_06222 [Salinomyces thailandicus]|uniref:Amino acid transporter transmembrane domain-containing protein n=1 Tax=Salinomyces thailandicus TaxID=706561 RepID=A0A4U0TT16_9PEZI|nr:hypothetical protein B0A50_06222 [Salinomyces thailandica]